MTSLPLIAGKVRVDLPGGSGWIYPELTYYNGTPHWLDWVGKYRGTWFNTQDFIPGSTGYNVDCAEYWFYEHELYPWDTDQFCSEVWNGDQTGPQELLVQEVVTALHYAPCHHIINPWIETGQHFWFVVNTEISAGGWPSILGDYSMPGESGHSLYSYDFNIWESWGEWGEFAIAEVFPGSIESTTWGSLKALF